MAMKYLAYDLLTLVVQVASENLHLEGVCSEVEMRDYHLQRNWCLTAPLIAIC